MIHTNTTDLSKVKAMGVALKKAVNQRYNLLEIEMDGFFQRMLLLQKKKYAALAVTEKDGKITTFLETKGLDLVRRDWCGLSHDVSSYILAQIFSGENREDVVDRIHIYLAKVAQEVRDGLIPVDKYIITKSLTKNPEEYADKKSQPHVQVALAMKKRGRAAKVGDVIPYVICVGEGSILASRAFHPDDLTSPDSELKVGIFIINLDFSWYLSNQIHPPVARLCAPIDGTDIPRLANCLGLDVSKYQNTNTSTAQEEELYTFESTIPEKERFKDVERWTPRCNSCEETSEFVGFFKDHDRVKGGFNCAKCDAPLSFGSLSCQLLAKLRGFMCKYLDQAAVCDDAACRTKTRACSVFGRRCLVTGCKGFVNLEYSDSRLYTQMQYYEHLFSLDAYITKLEPVESDMNTIKAHAKTMENFSELVERYLNTSSRRYIDLAQIFSFQNIQV